MKNYCLFYFIITSLAISIPAYPMGWRPSLGKNWQETATKAGQTIAVLYALGYFACLLRTSKKDSPVPSFTSKSKPWAALEARYRKEFDEEESKIINELLDVTGVTHEQWKKKKMELQQNYAGAVRYWIPDYQMQHPKPISPALKDIITTVLIQQGIDPAIVTFIRDDRGRYNMAVQGGIDAGKAIFFVNEENCKVYSPKTLEFIMLHEIQHLKHNDNFITYLITKSPKNNTILHDHTVFTERRADILAALISLEHAQAAYNLMCLPRIFIPCNIFITWILNKLVMDDGSDQISRSANMRKLYWEMMECVEQQKKGVQT